MYICLLLYLIQHMCYRGEQRDSEVVLYSIKYQTCVVRPLTRQWSENHGLQEAETQHLKGSMAGY